MIQSLKVTRTFLDFILRVKRSLQVTSKWSPNLSASSGTIRYPLFLLFKKFPVEMVGCSKDRCAIWKQVTQFIEHGSSHDFGSMQPSTVVQSRHKAIDSSSVPFLFIGKPGLLFALLCFRLYYIIVFLMKKMQFVLEFSFP